MLNSHDAFVRQELLEEAREIEARLARWENLTWIMGGAITKLQRRLDEVYKDLEKLDMVQHLNPLGKACQ